MIIRRGHYAYFFFYWLYGVIMDHRLAGRSLSHTIYNDSQGAFPVQSISYPYIREFEKHLDFKSDEVFVDVGCAWGRLLGHLLTHSKIKRFLGVELNPEVAKCAQHIFRNVPNIEIISGDILTSLPKEGTIFYLFNPFDEVVFRRFIEKIEESISHPVKLLYLHPMYRHILDVGRPNWTITKECEIKPRYLGALTFCLYEYTPKGCNGT